MRMYECVKSTAEYCNNCRVFFHTFIYHTQHESKLICHGDRKKLEKKTLAEILNYRSHTNKMDNWEEYFLKPTQHFQSHWHQPFLIILFTWEAGVGWGEGGIPVVSYFIFCYIYICCVLEVEHLGTYLYPYIPKCLRTQHIHTKCCNL